MTRRITLPLAESTTETHCMSCPQRGTERGPYASGYPTCGVFDTTIMDLDRVNGDVSPKRLPECVAAEQADVQRERDAAFGARVRRSIAGMDPEGRPERLESIAVDYGPDYWEHDILMALAAALREEHGR